MCEPDNIVDGVLIDEYFRELCFNEPLTQHFYRAFHTYGYHLCSRYHALSHLYFSEVKSVLEDAHLCLHFSFLVAAGSKLAYIKIKINLSEYGLFFCKLQL